MAQKIRAYVDSLMQGFGGLGMPSLHWEGGMGNSDRFLGLHFLFQSPPICETSLALLVRFWWPGQGAAMVCSSTLAHPLTTSTLPANPHSLLHTDLVLP